MTRELALSAFGETALFAKCFTADAFLTGLADSMHFLNASAMGNILFGRLQLIENFDLLGIFQNNFDAELRMIF